MSGFDGRLGGMRPEITMRLGALSSCRLLVTARRGSREHLHIPRQRRNASHRSKREWWWHRQYTGHSSWSCRSASCCPARDTAFYARYRRIPPPASEPRQPSAAGSPQSQRREQPSPSDTRNHPAPGRLGQIGCRRSPQRGRHEGVAKDDETGLDARGTRNMRSTVMTSDCVASFETRTAFASTVRIGIGCSRDRGSV